MGPFLIYVIFMAISSFQSNFQVLIYYRNLLSFSDHQGI